MEEKGSLKGFQESLEEYLCSVALLVMAFVTFMSVFSRKIIWFNMLFAQELMTTMFVWVCCPTTASMFRIDSHMGFDYLTDKFIGAGRKAYRTCRLLLCFANYGIWTTWGTRMVYRQYHYHLFTGVLEVPQWTTGVAISLLAVFSIARMVQYEIRLAKSS